MWDIIIHVFCVHYSKIVGLFNFFVLKRSGFSKVLSIQILKKIKFDLNSKNGN